MSNVERTELRELAATTNRNNAQQPIHDLITPLRSFRRYTRLRIDANADGDGLIERDICRGKRTRRDLSFDFDEEDQVRKRIKTIDLE
jgi:hypothetical protein